MHDNFSTKFLSFTDDHHATPVQDTAQRRPCADMQQGPIPRILFRLRPCVNLFYCLLLIHIPWILSTIEKDADVLACGHVRILHVPGHQGLIKRALFIPVYIIMNEYLRECSASRVCPYMHQLRIMSFVKCWVCPAPVFCCLTCRSIG